MSTTSEQKHPLVDALAEVLPPVIWRSDWDRLRERHGLPYSARHLANLSCPSSKNAGPPVHHSGKRAYYLRDEVLSWLQGRG